LLNRGSQGMQQTNRQGNCKTVQKGSHRFAHG
jgi:hypothetical protein